MGKTHRKSIIKQAIERFDSLMAIGESRFEAKQAARREAKARGELKIVPEFGSSHEIRNEIQAS